MVTGVEVRHPGHRSIGATWALWWHEAVLQRIAVIRHIPLAGWRLVVPATLLSVLSGVLPVGFVLASSVLVGRVPEAVADGVGSPAWDHLVVAFAVAAAAFFAQQVLAPVQTALGEAIRWRVDGIVQQRMVQTALRSTGIGPLEDPAALDALTAATRFIERGWQTAGSACAGMIALIGRYVRLLSFVVMVGLVAGWFAGIALGVTTMIFRYGQRGGMRKFSRVFGELMPLYRREEYLRDAAIGPAGAKEIRVFGLTGWLGGRYADVYLQSMHHLWTARRKVFLWPYLAYTAIGLVVATSVLVTLARQASAGVITLTELTLALQATLAAIVLGEHYPEADLQTNGGVRGAQAFEEFGGFVDAAEAAQPPRSPESPQSGQGRIDRPDGAGGSLRAMPQQAVRFSGVSFSYPGSAHRVLDGLDLDLPAGLCTAVVGVNGAGKTTLVKLLTRLYEPSAGAIEVDGHDIAGLDPTSWRRQVGVIFQDFVRYELSATDNIALGAPYAPRRDAAVRSAAERAGILDVLDELPAGLDTPLARAYEGGVDLSGGQWQRVAIARALFALDAGAKVLVLDEPTSALDVRAEAEFFDRFVEVTRGATALLISHRFSSVRRADRIVVIDAGRVVEQGDHESLMAADGRYAGLFRLQARRFAQGLDAEDDE